MAQERAAQELGWMWLNMNIPDFASATEKRDGAYEIKFLLPESVAAKALDWSRKHLLPDPHCDSPNGDGYRVNSLYFDTPELDVYQRKGSYSKAKYRIRRYGAEATIFLERKLKSRGLVSKRRTRIPDEDLFQLVTSEPAPSWVGYWFRRRLSARQLLPQCQIRYQRVARIGSSPDGPLRMTMDRNVCGFPSKEYKIHETGPWMPLLPDQCILELKFRLNLPPLFKGLLEELALTPQPVSKYRLSIQAAGLTPKPKAVEEAAGNGHLTAEAFVAAHHSALMNGNRMESRV